LNIERLTLDVEVRGWSKYIKCELEGTIADSSCGVVFVGYSVTRKMVADVRFIWYYFGFWKNSGEKLN